MSRVATRLAAVLARDAARHGLAIDCAIETRPWCAALFDGVQAAVTVTAPAGVARDAWLVGLAEVELPMAGWCVADLAVDRTDEERTLLSALLIVRD